MEANIKAKGIATALSALIAMALAAAVAGRGCLTKADGPTDAVHAFVRASHEKNKDALLPLLGPKTLATLKQAAAEATHLVGGEGRYTARDMLTIFTIGPAMDKIVNLGRDGNEVTIALTDKLGNKSIITTVLIHGKWLIELELNQESDAKQSK